MPAKLEKFFQSENVSRAIELAQEATKTVGDGVMGPIEKRFTPSTGAQINGLPIEISGQLLAGGRIYGVGKPVSVFEFENPPSSSAPLEIASKPLPGSESQPEQARPPGTSAYTELILEIGAGASVATGTLPLQSLKLAAEASASGSIRYRHLLPAKPPVKRVDAMAALLKTAAPPHRVKLQELRAGELHTLDARFNLGFALRADWGTEFDVSAVVDLFEGVSATLQAHAEATVQASLGWSLYDRVQISLGRVNVTADKGTWARLRLQRLNRRNLTLGAKLAVQVDYDAGQATFAALLDRILNIEPLQRLFGALDRIEELGLHEIDSEAGWNAIRDKLSGRLQDLVVDYVDPGALIGALPWEKVEPFVQDVAKLVTDYRNLDQKVQSLVESTLGRVGLGSDSKIRASLNKIAGLDSTDLDAVLDRVIQENFEDAIDLLELLGGSSLEDLTIGSRADGAIQEASDLAEQALGFLDGLGDQAVARLDKFTKESGIESVASWLEKNATNTAKLKASLEQKATDKIRGVVSRLVNKAWDKLSDADLQKVQKFAKSLVKLNDDKDKLVETLQGAVAKLKGSAGFSVGIEISRLTERAALLDLEVDVDNAQMRRLLEGTALRDLSARELLEELPSPKEDDKGTPEDDERDEELGYRLRDSVFSYRRVRSSSMSAFASLFGIKRSTRRETVRVDEEVVRVSADSQRQRQATYSAGTVRRLIEKENPLAGNHELGVWLTQRLEGRGFNVNSQYETVTGTELRVTYSRSDLQTSPEELRAFGNLLAELGFQTPPGNRAVGDLAAAGVGFDTEFSFAIEYGPTGAVALLADGDAAPFRVDYRNASLRWLDDRLGHKQDKAFQGDLLAGLIEHQKFNGALRQGVLFYESGVARTTWTVPLDGGGRSEPITAQVGGQRVGRFKQVTEVLMKCSRAAIKLEDAFQVHDSRSAKPKPSELREFGKKFATWLKRTPFSSWPTPLFNLWLVHARIARQNVRALDEARGIAEVRFRENANQEWEKVLYKLEGAQAGDEIFPFPR